MQIIQHHIVVTKNKESRIMQFELSFTGSVIVTEQVQLASKKPPFRKYVMVKTYPGGVFFVDELIPCPNGSVLQVHGTIEPRDKGVNLKLMSASLDGERVFERAERAERGNWEQDVQANLDGEGRLKL